MQAPAWHETQVRVIPQGPRDLVMSRSAVRVRSSAPQLRLRNQAFATGGTSPAPKLESAYDNNATAAGDRRNPRGRGWITIGRGGKRPAGPQDAQIAPGRVGTSAPCPLDLRDFQAAVRADRVARRQVAIRFRGGQRPSGVRRCAGPCRPRRAPPPHAPLYVCATHQTSCRYVAHQSARVVQFEAQCMGRFPT